MAREDERTGVFTELKRKEIEERVEDNEGKGKMRADEG